MKFQNVSSLFITRSAAVLAFGLSLAGSAASSSAATIFGAVWGAQSSQLLSKASAATITTDSGTITLGYTTQSGSFDGSGIPSGTTTASTRDWGAITSTNYFGAESPKTSLRLGLGTVGDNVQEITFSAPVTNPYVYMNYIRGGAVYDFTGYDLVVIDSGAVSVAGSKITGTTDIQSPLSAFIVQLTGTFNSLNFKINTTNQTGVGSASEITIALPVAAPVPEPSGFALAAAGMMGLLGRRRRRPQQA